MLNSVLSFLLAITSAGTNKLPDTARNDDYFRWPENYSPAKSSFYVENQIEIKAGPETVWNILIHAREWPDWYSGAKNVKVPQPDGNLQLADVFSWRTMGLSFHSSIKEFDPPYRLSWESKKNSIRGYHSWVIIPTPEGCKVITAESQNGWLTFFEKVFQPKKLERLHEVWLQELKKRAEK